MSVDTHLKGKNLAPYRVARHGELEVLVSPALRKIADRAVLDVRRGVFGARLVALVSLRHPTC